MKLSYARGRCQETSRIAGQEFRSRYEREKLIALSEKTLHANDTAFNHLEKEIAPNMLESLTSEQKSCFRRKLAEKGIMPATLKQLPRHSSIETIMKNYIEHEADDVAADLWALQGNALGNIGPKAAEEQKQA